MAERRGDIIEQGASESQTEGRSDGRHDKPEWLRQRLDWFQDRKFGLFLHWGMYCQWDCCESWPLVEEDTWARPDDMKCWAERGRDYERFCADYRALNRTFNPTDFDPVVWADAARRAGMEYVTFTTKHHDGFCMWDTATTQYKITGPDCPFHADPRSNIARQVFDAFRARDMAISCYFSKSDWHVPYYWDPSRPAHTRNPNYDTHAEAELWEKFVQYTHGQIEELMTGYGPIDMLWLDGGQVRPPDQDIRMDEIAAMARRHQPGLIMADRTVGNDFEDFITPEQMIPDMPPDGPWESCLTMGHSWKYVPDDDYKSTPELLRMLVEVVAKGGNLLLGVGPTPEGTLPAEALRRLEEIGAWMEVNGEAIHGTRPVPPYRDGEAFYTAKGDRVYAILFAADEAGGVTLRGPAPRHQSQVQVLGRGKQVGCSATDEGVRVALPPDVRGALAQGRPAVLRFETQGNH
ncbi:MAG: alpha-L-fucosidase [Gemmatimonadetes bacterium]|jgi:alpha-L-fucosidase|nr:alpha-L-fucosidase [Gemmatimonadota bacterium]MBT6143886.1 alpha-L-fucosidase [Gemmatimonadota bacterium]MBT7863036.1 alpha-L-fucosidase [Gemmatimonadota bacterium]